MATMNLELEQARQSASMLATLERDAARLPELERRAEQEQRVESATARLSQAVAIHKAAATEARVKIADYRERLGPVIKELDKLARILGAVGAEMRDAKLRLSSACYDLSQAREPAVEDYREASLNARVAETVLDDLGLEQTDDLTPWAPVKPENAETNALIQLIVNRTAAQGGTVFEPVFITRLY